MLKIRTSSNLVQTSSKPRPDEEEKESQASGLPGRLKGASATLNPPVAHVANRPSSTSRTYLVQHPPPSGGSLDEVGSDEGRVYSNSRVDSKKAENRVCSTLAPNRRGPGDREGWDLGVWRLPQWTRFGFLKVLVEGLDRSRGRIRHGKGLRRLSPWIGCYEATVPGFRNPGSGYFAPFGPGSSRSVGFG